MSNTNRVWFITGSSTGFGRELAEQVLAGGERVVATARKPADVEDLVEKYPDTARAIKLDVTNDDDVKTSVAKAVEEFGTIDILVNNAGYGLGGGIEEPSMEQIKTQYDTNILGVIRVMREVLPLMRKQKSGHVLNLSSVVGITAFPSSGYYSSTKFAVEALSEALSKEVEHLGIKVTIVEPGGFRTDFAGRSFTQPANRIDDYITSERTDAIGEYHNNQPGDPVKAVKAMIEIADMENPPLRLPLGEDALENMEAKLKALKENIEEMREIAVNTKVDEVQAEGAGS